MLTNCTSGAPIIPYIYIYWYHSPIHFSIHPSIHLPICLSITLFTHPFICPSIHLVLYSAIHFSTPLPTHPSSNYHIYPTVPHDPSLVFGLDSPFPWLMASYHFSNSEQLPSSSLFIQILLFFFPHTEFKFLIFFEVFFFLLYHPKQMQPNSRLVL